MALQRREAHTPGAIVFAHPTGPLHFAATIIAGAWLIPALFPTFLPVLIPWLFPLANPHLAIITSAFSVAFLGFVPQVLRFAVAADNGLTTRLLIFKKTLPWRAIDWVYLHQKTTHRRRFGGGLVQDSALYLIPEAGKKRKIRLLLKRNSSIGGDYSALFAAIQWYAPHAQIGYDKRFVVTAMRAKNF